MTVPYLQNIDLRPNPPLSIPGLAGKISPNPKKIIYLTGVLV
jgi:hypothetical protein